MIKSYVEICLEKQSNSQNFFVDIQLLVVVDICHTTTLLSLPTVSFGKCVNLSDIYFLIALSGGTTLLSMHVYIGVCLFQTSHG